MSIEAISDVLARMPKSPDTHRSTPAYARILPENPSRSHETAQDGTIPPDDVDKAIEAVSGAFEGLSDAVAEILAEKPGGRTRAEAEMPERFDITKPKTLRQDGLLAVEVLSRLTEGHPFTHGDARVMIETIRQLIARSDKLDGFDTNLRHWREEVGKLQSRVGTLTHQRDEQVEARKSAERARTADREAAGDLAIEMVQRTGERDDAIDERDSLAEQLATTRKANDDLAAQLVAAKGIVEDMVTYARPSNWEKIGGAPWATRAWMAAVAFVGEPGEVEIADARRYAASPVGAPDPTPALSGVDHGDKGYTYGSSNKPAEPRMVDKAPTAPRYQPTREEVDARIASAIAHVTPKHGARCRTFLALTRWPVNGERGA